MTRKTGRKPGTPQGRETAREAYFRARTALADLELERKRGDLVPTAFALELAAKTVGPLREALLNLPALLQQRHGWSAGAAATVETEVRAILLRLAGLPPDTPRPPGAVISEQEALAATAACRPLRDLRVITDEQVQSTAEQAKVSTWALARELLDRGFIPRGADWVRSDRAHPWRDPLVRQAIDALDRAVTQQRLEGDPAP